MKPQPYLFDLAMVTFDLVSLYLWLLPLVAGRRIVKIFSSRKIPIWIATFSSVATEMSAMTIAGVAAGYNPLQQKYP